MTKTERQENYSKKTYGIPLYCAAWIPFDLISGSSEVTPATAEEAADKHEEGEKTIPTTGGNDPIIGSDGSRVGIAYSSPSPANQSHLLLALGGGGGEGRSGVPNAVLLTTFDLNSRSLSDNPLHRVGTEGDLPYRMAMHPGGHGFICSFPKNCRWFEWDIPRSNEPSKLALKSAGSTLQQLRDVGLQLALTFSSEGTSLATGGEDGHLRVFKWPSMDIVFDQIDAHTTIKCLDFSSDGKHLVSLGGSGPCRVWDLTSSTALATLQVEEGERYSFCKFSQNNDILYVTAMQGDIVKVISWSTSSWKRVGSNIIGRDPISAFSASYDGKLLALGTIEGDIKIITISDFRIRKLVKKAHLGLVTALAFSKDSRFLVSTSFDSIARVTVIGDKENIGSILWLAVAALVVLLAIFAYLLQFDKIF